jgi:hypothetical protein
MIPVENVPEMERGDTKESGAAAEFKYDTFYILSEML